MLQNKISQNSKNVMAGDFEFIAKRIIDLQLFFFDSFLEILNLFAFTGFISLNKIRHNKQKRL